MMLDGTFTVRLTEEKVTRFLEGLIKAVNMTLVWGPYVHQGRNGLHGLAMWDESHVALHTAGPTAFAEVYSCKSFLTNWAKSYIVNNLGMTVQNESLIIRSMEGEEA